MKDLIRGRIFAEWMSLKNDAQNMAGIVQNDVELTGQDLVEWELNADRFRNKVESLIGVTRDFAKTMGRK